MTKRLIGLLGLAIALMCLMGCSKTQSEIKKEARFFWGNKTEIKAFLDRPDAISERWLLEAIGQ
jgi:hypothetical protein